MARGKNQNQAEDTQDEQVDEVEGTEEEITEETASSESTEGEALPAQSTGIDVSGLTPDGILALLEQRRNEITSLNKVAKERGIKVPTKSKPKVEDKDRLDEFWEGVGYGIGMRRWANQRAQANLERALAVVALLGESFGVEEQAQAIELLGAGYIKAGRQSSFKSEIMKDKATREGAKPEDVLQEFWDSFDLAELPGLREAIREAM